MAAAYSFDLLSELGLATDYFYDWFCIQIY